jgi:hypothetical protein
MRSTTAFLAMLLIIGQIASACHGPLISPTGQPTTCDELSEADLVGESMGVMSDEEAQRWIFERYGVQASVGADYGSHHSLYWRTDGKYYSMLLGDDRTSLGMVWETGFPTVQQVLDCLGEPEYYRAYLDPTPGPIFTQLILLYPSQGLSFGVTLFEPVEAFEVTAPVKSVGYSKFGSIEEVILASAIIEPGSEQFNRIFASVKPWPGSLDRIVVDPPLSR